MEKGFIQDMLDVKVLILYVMNRVMYPVDIQKIYELCYQDDKLSYFDLAQAVPEMIESGHLLELEAGLFAITAKGRDACEVTEDAIAYPVMQRALAAVEQFNRQVRRSGFVKTAVAPRQSGDYSVQLTLCDGMSDLLRLELMAPTQKQAYRLARAFSGKAEEVYRAIMDKLLTDMHENT